MPLTGPAAAITGEFNLNGITATPNGDTPIVAHTANGALCTVDPSTGASESIMGVSVPGVDGIVLEAAGCGPCKGARTRSRAITSNSPTRPTAAGFGCP